MKRPLAALLLVTLSGGWGGCADRSALLDREPQPPFEYAIGPEDVLDVVVWKDPDASKVVTVRPDGKISLPLIGELQAAGYTPLALQEEIARRLSAFKRAPEATVIVQQVNSYYFYIQGEVEKPGKYPMNSSTTVLQAISLAGGLTPFASQQIRVLRRNGPAAPPGIHRFHYKKLLSEKGVDPAVFLRPGDTIIVP
ncbi:MAG: polysaccharide biosynthesis/export family protein [Nitrospirota bacterium]